MLNSMTSRMAAASAAMVPPEPACEFHYDAHTFESMASLQREFFGEMKRKHGTNLFTTDAHIGEPLAAVFLNHLPDEVRQDHMCNCCRGFLKRYGGLAVIDDNGRIRSALWGFGGYPRVYASAVSTLDLRVARAKVTGVFLHDEALIARPHDGTRTHFALQHDKLFTHDVLTKSQAMAAKREDHKNLKRALEVFNRKDCNRALTMLAADALYRGEKYVAPVRFLIEAFDAIERTNPARWDNILWQMVAEAPAGFCSPRGTMVGTLIEDIQKGLPEHTIKAKFADKMAPTKYQRPVSAPSAGNVAQAEKLVETLGIESALQRRFLLRHEVKATWSAQAKRPAVVQTGVFAGVDTKDEATRRVPLGHPVASGPITWAKFTRDVLPQAIQIEVDVEPFPGIVSLVTAVDPSAKPIMSWDYEDERNPVSWYVYSHPRAASNFAISAGWNRVDMISTSPTTWGRTNPHVEHNKVSVLYIEGAYDRGYSSGLMLFPEILRSALHPVRATIERFSNKGVMARPDERAAAGLIVGGKRPVRVRVTTDHGVITYTIDRLE